MKNIRNFPQEKNIKIKSNFTLTALTIGTIFITSSITFYSYQLLRKSFLQNSKKNAVLEVQQAVNKVDKWLATQKSETVSIANTPILKTMDWDRVEPYYQAEIDRLKDFFFFAMVYPDGSYYNTKVGFAENQNIKDRKHIQMGMAGKTYVSDPVPSRTVDDAMIVVISTPVWSDDPQQQTPIGVTSGIMSLEQVTNVVSALQYGEESYAFALNSEGKPIIDTNQKIIPEQNQLNFQHIQQKMLQKQTGIEQVNLDSYTVYIAYVPITEADWSIGLVIPRENIESQLRPLEVIALMVAGLIIASISILWQVQAIKQRELKRSKEAADAANQAKSDFLSNMSHELRTPLNGILGYAQILSRSASLSPKERHGINIIYECGSHLLMLINDVLDLSKIEARKLDLNLTALHFPSLLQSVVEMCEIRAKEKSIDFVYQPDPQLPESIKGDEKRLRQVLINLLGNATKFTETGSVSLAVEVLGYPTGDRVQLKFQVADTGVGIAPDDLNRLFQVFEQVGDRRKKSEGTGLGLAISQKIVQLMGGRIEVTSQLGIGTQFFFTLEFPVVQNWVQQQSKNSPEKIVGYVGDRRKILIIDDRPENRAVLVSLLEPWGFEVSEAENGLEGLEKMRQENPNLVILDLEMPVMDGFQFMKNIRQNNCFKDSKIIVSSASVSHADRQMALEAGGNDFLPKPIDIKELIECLSEHLNLEWISEQNQADETEQKEKQQIILPSPQDLKDLLAIAQQGDTRGIREKIESLISTDDRYQEFANLILNLAKQFKIEEIEDILQNHLEQEKSHVK